MNEQTQETTVVVASRSSTLRWPLATDEVMRTTATMPDSQRDAFRWLQNYALTANMSPAEIAVRVTKPDGTPYSEDSIYQTLKGKRSAEGANIQPLADAVVRFRRLVEEVEARAATPFIETPLTRRMFRIFKSTMELHRIAFIYGASQIGKTTTANEFQRRNNHGRTRIIRMPASGCMGDTYTEFSVCLGIPVKRRIDDVRRRIINSFDESNLLIIDEAHSSLLGRYGESSAKVLEFIREIHDRRKCGIVLIGTSVLREALQHNKVLQQLWKRRSPGLVLNLPETLDAPDIDTFAKAFGLDPAPDRDMTIRLEGDRGTVNGNPNRIQREMIATHGLGCWIRLLEDTRDAAKEARRPMTWGRVVATYLDALANEG